MCNSAVLLQHSDLTPHGLCAFLQVEDKVETLIRGTSPQQCVVPENSDRTGTFQMVLCISTEPASPLLPIYRILSMKVCMGKSLKR